MNITRTKHSTLQDSHTPQGYFAMETTSSQDKAKD